MIDNCVVEQFNTSKIYNGLKKLECSVPEFNSFCKNNLKKNVANNFIDASVLLDTASDGLFVGFYTIKNHRINKPLEENLSKEELKIFKHAPSTIAITRLTMLGLKRTYEGNSLGKLLLINAIKRVYDASKHINTLGLYIDAVENKIEFYKYYNFKEIGSLVDHGKIKTCPMLLHIETIKDLFKQI